MKVFAISFLSGFLLLATSMQLATAQETITEEQALSFGSFALVSSGSASSLEVPYTGSTPNATGGLYPLTQGEIGQYRLTGFPAFIAVSISIPDFSLSRGTGKVFTVGSFTHAAVFMDSNGEALLELGATLSTDGDSTSYFDTDYTGTMSITTSY